MEEKDIQIPNIYPNKYLSISAPTRAGTHAHRFTVIGLVPCAIEACCFCLLNWLHMQIAGHWLFVSLVFVKLHSEWLQKYSQIGSLSMVEQAACLRIVTAYQDRSAVNYCAQVRFTFKIIDK